ncbi:MAG: transposase [Candidatus Nitrosotenuis sp.]
MQCSYVIRMPANKRVKSMRMKHGERVRYSFNDGLETDLVRCFVEEDEEEMAYYLATNMKHDANKLLDMYRNRWGIETSYRVIEQFMPQTTSKAYVIRLFYFLFAVWMYNLWIIFNINLQGYGVSAGIEGGAACLHFISCSI